MRILGDPLGDLMGDPLGNPLGNSLGNPLGDLLGNPLGDSLGNPLGDRSTDSLGVDSLPKVCSLIISAKQGTQRYSAIHWQLDGWSPDKQPDQLSCLRLAVLTEAP